MKRFYTTKFKGKKHTEQESKNKEVTKGISERDLQNFKLVRLILDRGSFYNMTAWKRTDSVNYLLKKENQYLLAKVILYTPNQIKSYWKYVRKLYF